MAETIGVVANASVQGDLGNDSLSDEDDDGLFSEPIPAHLPNPWIDEPPQSRTYPGIAKTLKKFHNRRRRMHRKDDTWPYRPHPLEPSYVLFFEFRGYGPPPEDVGYPGDVYIDLAPVPRRLLYVCHGVKGWKCVNWSPNPNVVKFQIPVHPLLKGRYLWGTESSGFMWFTPNTIRTEDHCRHTDAVDYNRMISKAMKYDHAEQPVMDEGNIERRNAEEARRKGLYDEWINQHPGWAPVITDLRKEERRQDKEKYAEGASIQRERRNLRGKQRPSAGDRSSKHDEKREEHSNGWQVATADLSHLPKPVGRKISRKRRSHSPASTSSSDSDHKKSTCSRKPTVKKPRLESFSPEVTLRPALFSPPPSPELGGGNNDKRHPDNNGHPTRETQRRRNAGPAAASSTHPAPVLPVHSRPHTLPPSRENQKRKRKGSHDPPEAGFSGGDEGSMESPWPKTRLPPYLKFKRFAKPQENVVVKPAPREIPRLPSTTVTSAGPQTLKAAEANPQQAVSLPEQVIRPVSSPGPKASPIASSQSPCEDGQGSNNEHAGNASHCTKSPNMPSPKALSTFINCNYTYPYPPAKDATRSPLGSGGDHSMVAAAHDSHDSHRSGAVKKRQEEDDNSGDETTKSGAAKTCNRGVTPGPAIKETNDQGNASGATNPSSSTIDGRHEVHDEHDGPVSNPGDARGEQGGEPEYKGQSGRIGSPASHRVTTERTSGACPELDRSIDERVAESSQHPVLRRRTNSPEGENPTGTSHDKRGCQNAGSFHEVGGSDRTQRLLDGDQEASEMEEVQQESANRNDDSAVGDHTDKVGENAGFSGGNSSGTRDREEVQQNADHNENPNGDYGGLLKGTHRGGSDTEEVQEDLDESGIDQGALPRISVEHEVRCKEDEPEKQIPLEIAPTIPRVSQTLASSRSSAQCDSGMAFASQSQAEPRVDMDLPEELEEMVQKTSHVQRFLLSISNIVRDSQTEKGRAEKLSREFSETQEAFRIAEEEVGRQPSAIETTKTQLHAMGDRAKSAKQLQSQKKKEAEDLQILRELQQRYQHLEAQHSQEIQRLELERDEACTKLEEENAIHAQSLQGMTKQRDHARAEIEQHKRQGARLIHVIRCMKVQLDKAVADKSTSDQARDAAERRLASARDVLNR